MFMVNKDYQISVISCDAWSQGTLCVNNLRRVVTLRAGEAAGSSFCCISVIGYKCQISYVQMKIIKMLVNGDKNVSS